MSLMKKYGGDFATSLNSSSKLRLSSSFLQSDSCKGGYLDKDGKLTWISNGCKFYLLRQKNGQVLFYYSYMMLATNGKKFNITACKKLGNMLVVALNIDDGSGLLSIFNFSTKVLLKNIQLPYAITSFDCISDDHHNNKMQLSKQLHLMKGIVAVGTQHGHIYLIDLRLDTEASSTFCKIEPVPIVVRDIKKLRHQFNNKQLHMAFELSESSHENDEIFHYINQDDEIITTYHTSHDIHVTSCYYEMKSRHLFVGFSFGQFQIYDMRTLSLVFSSTDKSGKFSIVNFAVQEPENDPRNFIYLWVVQSRNSQIDNEKKSATSSSHKDGLTALMYQVEFEDKEIQTCYTTEVDNTTSLMTLYSGFLSCNIKYQCKYVENVDMCRVLQCNTIELYTSQTGGVAPHMGNYPPPPTTSDDIAPSTSIFFLSWQSVNNDVITVYTSLFDINNWYMAQMPTHNNKNPAISHSSYTIKRKMNSIFENNFERILALHINEDSLKWIRTRLHPAPHQFLQPSAITYIVSCLQSNQSAYYSVFGVQKQVALQLCEYGVESLITPQLAYQQMCEVGLIDGSSQHHKNLSVQQQRNEILNADITSNHRIHSSFTSQDLVDWSWNIVCDIKHDFNTICETIFDYSIETIDVEQSTKLSTIQSQLKDISHILQMIYQHQASNKITVVELLRNYVKMMLWLIEVNILPEQSTTTSTTSKLFYDNHQLSETLQQRRNMLKKAFNASNIASCSASPLSHGNLMIDEIINNSDVTILNRWNKFSTTTSNQQLYPPPSILALLDMFYMENIDDITKKSIMLYFLLDIIATNQHEDHHMDEQDTSPLMNIINSFPLTFQLSDEVTSFIRAAWLIDRGFLEESFEKLCEPGVRRILEDYHHNHILHIYVIEDKSDIALKYLWLLNPPCQTVDDVKLHLKILCDNKQFYQAFELAKAKSKTHTTDDIFLCLFQLCYENNTFRQLLSLQLSPADDELLCNYLQERSTNKSRDMLILHHIIKSRHVEAVQLYQRCYHQKQHKKKQLQQENTDDTFMDKLIGCIMKIIPDIKRRKLIADDPQNKLFPTPSTSSISGYRQQRLDIASMKKLKNKKDAILGRYSVDTVAFAAKNSTTPSVYRTSNITRTPVTASQRYQTTTPKSHIKRQMKLDEISSQLLQTPEIKLKPSSKPYHMRELPTSETTSISTLTQSILKNKQKREVVLVDPNETIEPEITTQSELPKKLRFDTEDCEDSNIEPQNVDENVEEANVEVVEQHEDKDETRTHDDDETMEICESSRDDDISFYDALSSPIPQQSSAVQQQESHTSQTTTSQTTTSQTTTSQTITSQTNTSQKHDEHKWIPLSSNQDEDSKVESQQLEEKEEEGKTLTTEVDEVEENEIKTEENAVVIDSVETCVTSQTQNDNEESNNKEDNVDISSVTCDVSTEEEVVPDDDDEPQQQQDTDVTSQDNVDTSQDNVDTSQDNVDTSQDNVDTSQDNVDTSQDNVDTSQENVDTSQDNVDTSQEESDDDQEEIVTSQQQADDKDDDVMIISDDDDEEAESTQETAESAANETVHDETSGDESDDNESDDDDDESEFTDDDSSDDDESDAESHESDAQQISQDNSTEISEEISQDVSDVSKLVESPIEISDSSQEVSEPSIEVSEPALEVNEPALEVNEPALEVNEPSVEVNEPSVEVVELSAESVELSAESVEPSTESVEPPIEVSEPSLEVVEPSVEVDETSQEATEEMPEVPDQPIVEVGQTSQIDEKVCAEDSNILVDQEMTEPVFKFSDPTLKASQITTDHSDASEHTFEYVFYDPSVIEGNQADYTIQEHSPEAIEHRIDVVDVLEAEISPSKEMEADLIFEIPQDTAESSQLAATSEVSKLDKATDFSDSNQPAQKVIVPAVEVSDFIQEAADSTKEVTEPVAEVTEPVAEFNEPVVEVTEPDAEVNEPVAEVTEPDADTDNVEKSAEEKSDELPAEISEDFEAEVEQELLNDVETWVDPLSPPKTRSGLRRGFRKELPPQKRKQKPQVSSRKGWKQAAAKVEMIMELSDDDDHVVTKVTEPFVKVGETSQQVTELSQEVNEPSQEVNEPSQEVNEPSQEVNEPSQEVNETAVRDEISTEQSTSGTQSVSESIEFCAEVGGVTETTDSSEVVRSVSESIEICAEVGDPPLEIPPGDEQTSRNPKESMSFQKIIEGTSAADDLEADTDSPIVPRRRGRPKNKDTKEKQEEATQEESTSTRTTRRTRQQTEKARESSSDSSPSKTASPRKSTRSQPKKPAADQGVLSASAEVAAPQPGRTTRSRADVKQQDGGDAGNVEKLNTKRRKHQTRQKKQITTNTKSDDNEFVVAKSNQDEDTMTTHQKSHETESDSSSQSEKPLRKRRCRNKQSTTTTTAQNEENTTSVQQVDTKNRKRKINLDSHKSNMTSSVTTSLVPDDELYFPLSPPVLRNRKRRKINVDLPTTSSTTATTSSTRGKKATTSAGKIETKKEEAEDKKLEVEEEPLIQFVFSPPQLRASTRKRKQQQNVAATKSTTVNNRKRNKQTTTTTTTKQQPQSSSSSKIILSTFQTPSNFPKIIQPATIKNKTPDDDDKNDDVNKTTTTSSRRTTRRGNVTSSSSSAVHDSAASGESMTSSKTTTSSTTSQPKRSLRSAKKATKPTTKR